MGAKFFSPCTDPDAGTGPSGQLSRGSLPQTAFAPRHLLGSPEFLLDNHSRPASLPSLAAFLIAPVILLDQHSRTPALLEFLLFVVTSEFALDEDGSLCHLFIKCILQGKQEEAKPVTTGATRVLCSLSLSGEERREMTFSPLLPDSLCFGFNRQRGKLRIITRTFVKCKILL